MTQIWAHRGASGYAPENTLEAFKLAIDMQADGIELDVQLTKDGKLVVLHDESIDRTSDHQGYVKDFTLEELKTFNFNFHKEEYPFCQIPTLEEVIQLIKPTNLIINIELKTGIFVYHGIEKMVVDLVNQYDMADRVIYSSFNHQSVMRVKELTPKAYVGLLSEDWIVNYGQYCQQLGVNATHPALYFLLEKDFVMDVKTHGLDINVWTVNESEHIKMILSIGVNALITNYPDRAIEIRNSFNS